MNKVFNIRHSELTEQRFDVSKREDPYYHEVLEKWKCPRCGHHAFFLAPKQGLFHCWACDIYGRLEGYSGKDKFGNRKPISLGAGQIAARSKQSAQTMSTAPDVAADGLAQLTDYVPLPDETLADVQDISTDTVVTGAQLAVRQWLEAQHIPIELAIQMRWGVASKAVRAKADKAGGDNAAAEGSAPLKPCVAFRNYVEGYCCNIKYRCVSSHLQVSHRDGQRTEHTVWDKGFMQDSSFTPCAPYNIDCLRPEALAQITDPDQRVLYICEGEKDAATLLRLGCRLAISVANGAHGDVDREFAPFSEWLRPITTICVVGDQDSAGRMLQQKLCAAFDDRLVFLCKWDQRLWGKDISDVCRLHGEAKAIELIEAAQAVGHDDIEDFTSDEAIARSTEAAQDKYDHGYPVGLGPLTDQHLRLTQSGGLIIVTGTPNTGKTDFLNCLMMSLVHQTGQHVCFCSFETPDKYRHAGDLTHIWAGDSDLGQIPEPDVRQLVQHVTSHISHIDLRRKDPTTATILHTADRVLALHPDTRYLVIDPYLFIRLQGLKNETDQIKELLTTVQNWAFDRRVWVFIVAHPRKLKKEDGSTELEEIDYYTISGSANWANVADFVFSLKRIQKDRSDYTRLSVLKVRDQKICTPGDVFYKRQQCGRYDECRDERDAAVDKTVCSDANPWSL